MSDKRKRASSGPSHPQKRSQPSSKASEASSDAEDNISTVGPTDDAEDDTEEMVEDDAGGNTEDNVEDNIEDEVTEVVASSDKANTSAASKHKKERFQARFKPHENSNKAVLQAQMKGWRSEHYNHFKSPPEIVVEGNNVKYKFICLTHPSQSLLRDRWDDSTGNLIRHVTGCTKKVAPPGQSIASYAHGSTYSAPRFRYLLALWVSRRHRPFAIIADPELIEILKMLYGRVDIISPSTLSRDVREIFSIARENVGRMLQKHNGRLHLCIDGWTSPNTFSFLGVTVHRVVSGAMKTFILDFIKLTESHTGEYLASELARCLTELGIAAKILAITADNASNNNTLVADLELRLGGINSASTRVRCFAHILNLVVKAMISCFIKKRKRSGDQDEESDTDVDVDVDIEPEDEDDDEYEVDPDREAADDLEIEDIIAAMESEWTLNDRDAQAGRSAVSKLVDLAKRVFHSPSIREDLASCCKLSKIEPRQMVRSVATRWNSLTQAIARALYLRQALNKLVSLPKYDKSGKAGLRQYQIDDDEWVILEQLHGVLDSFLFITEQISQSNIPLLHEVIPLIDILNRSLEDAIANISLVRPVRIAAARGRDVLNKYYSSTDESIMYRGAMILHPKYKCDYFRRNGWEAEWIGTATALVREQWISHYKPTLSAPSSLTRASSTSSSTTPIAANRARLVAQLDDNTGADSEAEDAFEAYLASPVDKTISDPLLYWQAKLSANAGANGHAGVQAVKREAHALARMALDFLSAPASSTDVERAFSHGGLTVSKRRHGLSDESTRAATVLGSWAEVPGAIPEDKILKVFKNKAKRGKNRESIESGIPSMSASKASQSDVMVID